jgi:imidazolonepropionase-like amidohydrolase
MKLTTVAYSVFMAGLAIGSALAHDYVPGEPQTHAIMLQGGDLYTISGGVRQKTDVIFSEGRITQIGRNLSVPASCEVIDVSGKRVYPGLIAPYTAIGLVEIGEVRATVDTREVGPVNPDVESRAAYNPDSEIIPSVRSNGVTTALVVPGGKLLVGRSSLINLDGWTVEDAVEKVDVGLHIIWPQASVIRAWWMEKTPEEQKEEMEENRRLLFQAFDDARAYHLACRADSGTKVDSRWQAMIPVVTGEMPVFIMANDCRQIEQAMSFAGGYGLKMILVGGADAWMLTDQLKENNVAVIVSRTQALPMREDDGHDAAYRLPALLAEAGVKFCLSTAGRRGGTATGVRNLPLQAGQAVAYGLPKADALRAITLSTAEILGVADDLGSLEIGKKATLIVSEGDILDPVTHNVVLEFIEGRRVDLDNRHKELYRKYQRKHLKSH